jgi:hypothetical protein
MFVFPAMLLLCNGALGKNSKKFGVRGLFHLHLGLGCVDHIGSTGRYKGREAAPLTAAGCVHRPGA